MKVTSELTASTVVALTVLYLTINGTDGEMLGNFLCLVQTLINMLARGVALPPRPPEFANPEIRRSSQTLAITFDTMVPKCEMNGARQ